MRSSPRPSRPPTPLALALAALLMATGPALAQDDDDNDDERSELARKVDETTVEFQFLSTPIDKVALFLAKKTGLPIELSGLADGEAPVTFSGEGMPLRRALRWVSYLAGLDVHVGDERVLIGPPSEIEQYRTVLRTFDVRDLTVGALDFPAPSIGLRRRFDDGGLGVGFGDGSFGDEPLSVDLLRQLIEDNIEPESWDPPHSISVRQGVLFIRHRAEVLDVIGDFLADVRRSVSALVTVEAWFLSVGADDWERLFTDGEGPDARPLLDAEAWTALRERIAGADDVRRLAHLRTTCAPGQRSHAIAERSTAGVFDYDTQVAQGAAIADPIVGRIPGGAVIDVQPVPAANGETVTIELRARMARLQSRSIELGTNDPRPEGEPAARLDLPASDEIQLETVVRIPDRGAYVSTFVNRVTDEDRQRRLVLIVEPRIDRTDDGEDD